MSESQKVVYCLTGDVGGVYEAMTRVSLATLRISNPAANVVIACDEQTMHALQAGRSQLFKEADNVKGWLTPKGPAVFRNRFIKTQLRNLVEGPFLFIDSDTVVRKPLGSLLRLTHDVAAAPNHSVDDPAMQIWSEDRANLDTMGWNVLHPYVNGGVLWYAETEGARRFAESWHRHWLKNVEKTGRFRDQPALNFALFESGASINILRHYWNAQVQGAPKVAVDAVIWHLYLEWKNETFFEFKRQLNMARKSSKFDPIEIAKRLLSKEHPWCSRSVIDDWLAKRVIEKNVMTDTVKHWFDKTPARFAAWSVQKMAKRWVKYVSS